MGFSVSDYSINHQPNIKLIMFNLVMAECWNCNLNQ